MIKPSLSLLALLFAFNVAHAEPETYKIDNAHSFANWSLRHVVSKTSGTFSDITGSISIDRSNLANSSVNAKINVLSVNSAHPKRDEHIKKEDYLNAYTFGEMTFVSSKVVETAPGEGLLTGTLTLHGVSRELTMPFKVLGFGADPFGGYRSGFEAKTALKASDFGFKWGTKPNGPVGDDIEISLLIEGIRTKP
ncbi:YceI family protein [Methylobacillus flagellatus]|uniref:YceI family protein n=1 Tax=Methylobacillus flagellatus TaxID=405 RepID=UPI0010F874A6|nr:YceI family protein [Methylobacillus flagellatus]